MTCVRYLEQFAASVGAKFSLGGSGEPEEQLRAPFETFLQAMGNAFQLDIKIKGEIYLRGIGKPDFSVYCNNALCGYVELKQPGKGADPDKYSGHDRQQWERFTALPNILYTDGNEWALYQNGERIGRIVILASDIATKGVGAVSPEDARALEPLLREFVTWNPITPTSAKELATVIAPVCKLLRVEVDESMKRPDSPFTQLAHDWRETLFPGVTDAQFADAYAQTVTFALLLARAEGGNVESLRDAEKALAADHALLAKTLKIFTDELHDAEKPLSLGLLQRIIAHVSEAGWTDKNADPWLYFYEDFLAEYDPQLRKNVGAYYTPVQAMRCIVRLTDNVLCHRLGKTEGFASPGVMTVDPAVGTGTFPLGILAHSITKAQVMGPGAVAGCAEALAGQLHGFEMLVGPYSVSQLRLSRALVNYGASLPGGPKIYLTDTLESPNSTLKHHSFLTRELTAQHAKAQEIKKTTHILVCLGNPPYLRHEAVSTDDPKETGNRKETGGWIRWGDKENGKYCEDTAQLAKFSQPVKAAGLGGHLKNLYNTYTYFWSWALWKVFAQDSHTPGVVSFITASSFLAGPAFCGMREYMRTLCDEIWILDLGGEGRGSRKEENIFDIQTPVCIAIAVRYGKKKTGHNATVWYTRIAGTREQKLAELDSIHTVTDIQWQKCHTELQSPFKSAGQGAYFNNPLLTDILPWQHSGIQFKRTWPIGESIATLQQRWQALRDTPHRETAFRETDARSAARFYNGSAESKRLDFMPKTIRYGYRSFNRMYCFADTRFCDRPRPVLRRIYGPKQIYFASHLTKVLGRGPALTLTADLPDLDYFLAGGKDTIPLYRDADATLPNILPGLCELLSKEYSKAVTAEDVAAYLYAVLAHASFTKHFYEELETRELRVPLTKDTKLFARAVAIGQKLIWLHSYGERMIPEGHKMGVLPVGTAKCLKHIPSTAQAYPKDFSYNPSTATLHVGQGEIGPVAQEIFDFEVSGLKVVQSWLKYRMKDGAGRMSSPLDHVRSHRWTLELTTELLNLLWILEATLQLYPEQEVLLDDICDGPVFLATELPMVPEAARNAPVAEGELGAKRIKHTNGNLI